MNYFTIHEIKKIAIHQALNFLFKQKMRLKILNENI